MPSIPNGPTNSRAPASVARAASSASAPAASTSHKPRPKERQPRPSNSSGPWYVDSTCIDCDVCRWMAPDVFTRAADGMSAVTTQPGRDTRQQAVQALVSCPTFSIHGDDLQKGELQAAHATFPLPVEGCRDVSDLGFHDKSSYSATSYFIKRDGGNIIVDAPRFSPALLKRIQAEGGATTMLLTHRDDVGDHAKWAAALGLTRVIHEEDANSRQGTDECEAQLTGTGPWELPGGGEDLKIIHTPGHTKGHLCFWYEPDKAMFTGDHLAYSARVSRLSTFPRYNWYDHSVQLESVKVLLDYDIVHLLPGHGRRTTFRDAADRLARISAVIEADQQ